MESVSKVLQSSSDLEEIAALLYGDAAFEVVKALDPAKKEKRDKALQNVAIGTNMVGGVAGPAALGLAWRSRKEGGTPRAYAKPIARKLQGSKKPRAVRLAGMKTQKIANTLNRPGSKKAKIAAGVAGSALVGLQAVNWGGDMLSAKLLNDNKKKSVTKSRSEEHAPQKIKLIRLGSDTAFDTARHAPMVAATVKQKTRKIKKNQSEMDIYWQGEISKMDTDKRQVFGWASIIKKDGKDVVDLQGDYMDIDTIEKAAYNYVIDSRRGGNQHAREGESPREVSKMVESFLVTPEKRKSMGLPDSVPDGWWVGFQIDDDETWAQVKNGERTEFSIHGNGVKKAVELDD